MTNDYFRQQKDQSLYPDLLWSKPVTKRGAGKLLIIGGNAHGFAHVAKSYTDTEKASTGNIRAIVPDSLAKLTKGLEFIEYAPSNPSGGFARSALAPILELAEWSDGVLLAGDLGKNSETSLLLDSFLGKYTGVVTINSEALPSLSLSTIDLLASNHRVVIMTRADLQKAGLALKLPKAITSDMGKSRLAEILSDITMEHPAHLVILDDQTIWTASQGTVTSTDTKHAKNTAGFAVWALQNPTKIRQALACAAWELSQRIA